MTNIRKRVGYLSNFFISIAIKRCFFIKNILILIEVKEKWLINKFENQK